MAEVLPSPQSIKPEYVPPLKYGKVILSVAPVVLQTEINGGGSVGVGTGIGIGGPGGGSVGVGTGAGVGVGGGHTKGGKAISESGADQFEAHRIAS